MAEATKGVTNPTLSTPWPAKENLITGLLAGEDLGWADVVFLQTDGKWYKASGAAATINARASGFTTNGAKLGDPVTVIRKNSGVCIGYRPKIGAADAAPGTRFFLSGTVAGGLADAASTGGTEVLAYALGDGRILVGQI